MLIGLLCTASKRFPGTLIILFGATLYGVITGFVTFTPVIAIILTVLAVVAEVGGRVLRIYLTQRYSVSRMFSVNSTVSHFAGMLASDVLLGPILGLVVWELIAGKTLIPRTDTISQILFRLAGVAMLRFVCGLTMIVLIIIYIFI
ncbi:DUF456 family protein [Sporomusa carbonis]|uniref:DUF456 family protein n=1 Tax=Sporomusa carbonis TaxID=3076075 RepID=UPI003C7BC07C